MSKVHQSGLIHLEHLIDFKTLLLKHMCTFLLETHYIQ